ncbi:hypothetical protein [Nocardia sp. NPDC052566]|uniref:hypothetical protein n=1 Tax=Nocardia sp. NPDC052566 TaxID=3364330 RepID=UPI0037C8C0ED
MKRLIGKVCATVAVSAAIGIGVGAVPATAGAAAPGLPLEQAPEAVSVAPAPIFVPESLSAGPYNSFMCYLHTVSAAAPCMYS